MAKDAVQFRALEPIYLRKTKVISRLVGGVMRKTKGKADPEEATKLFEAKTRE